MKRPAGEHGYWHDLGTAASIDHRTLVHSDAARLRHVERLSLFTVRFPAEFFEGLSELETLRIVGGSAESLDPIAAAANLRYLTVHHVRGVLDISAIGRLTNLVYLSLYAFPRIERFPSLAGLGKLRRVELGSMRALSDISGLADAPSLEELVLSHDIGIDSKAVSPLQNHPTLRAFDWFWEDVPASRALPVLAAIGLPKAPATWSEHDLSYYAGHYALDALSTDESP